ncbi:MAG TPA: hypothetical protein VFK02_23520 [Kofleriaceae bacterium]|nr:hypothetical protein [Kofleriaceae bacterium]
MRRCQALSRSRARLAALATTALITLAAGAAHADPNRNEVWIGGEARALRTQSANALTADNLGGASFGVARELPVSVAPDLALWAVGGMTTGSASGTLFQTMTTELDTLDVRVGLRVRYALHRLIAASAQLELGGQRARVAIDDGAGAAVSDHAWGRMAEASAALDLFAVARPPLGIGMRAELGYAMAQAIELTPRGGSSGDALRLPAMEASLGRLDLSGPTFALSLVGQF